MTWELAEDMGDAYGVVALLTGHPDTLQKHHVRVKLFPAPAYQRGSFGGRALSWIRYWVRAFLWLWRWSPKTPTLFFSNPPILPWLGWLMRFVRGQRYAVMIHDIYPDILVRLSHLNEQHRLTRLWRWLNRQAYQRADLVMTLGEFMAINVERQFDATRTAAGKIEVVHPWVDTARIKPIPKKENWFSEQHGQDDKISIMYSGNMGLGHDIETMLEAARRLQNRPNCHFLFIGAGPKWKMVQAAQETERLTNVTLLPWQPEEAIPFSLATADIALVSVEPEICGLAVPSKFAYHLAAGAVILALTPLDSEIGSWLKANGCGRVIPLASADEVEQAVVHYITNLKSLSTDRKRSRAVAERLFDRSGQVDMIRRALDLYVIVQGKPGQSSGK